MFRLLPSEVDIVRGWSENALKKHGIPMPQEEALLKRISHPVTGAGLVLGRVELELALDWAEQNIRSHYGPAQFILEPEELLIKKIKDFLER
ncbi:MAG: hypothetical protein AB7W47_07065 [Calditrichaceae bacterium]